MRTIFHVSDVHFGPPHLPRVSEGVLELIEDRRPDVVVISGDLTQRARPEQFQAARHWVDRIPVPTVVVPGNHDVPLYRVIERVTGPHRLFREYIHEDLDPVLRLPDVVIVGLDSTAPWTALTNGRIVPSQLEHCERVLAAVEPGVARIVAAHHHFAPAPDYLHDRTVPKAKRAMRRFIELGVDMVLGGHLHRAFIGNSLDFFPGPERDRGVIIVQSGTTTSRRGRGREREKNSFNVIAIGRRTLRVTHHMFFDDHGGFSPVSSHAFPRAGLSGHERTEALAVPAPADRALARGSVSPARS